MGIAQEYFEGVKGTFNSMWDTQKELASSLIIGNRGIFNFSQAMEEIGFRGGLYNYTNRNGFAEDNVYKTPVNSNYVLAKPGLGPQIEGINRSETTETLYIGTPYVVRERFRKERSNAMLGDINFTDLTNEVKKQRKYEVEYREKKLEKPLPLQPAKGEVPEQLLTGIKTENRPYSDEENLNKDKGIGTYRSDFLEEDGYSKIGLFGDALKTDIFENDPSKKKLDERSEKYQIASDHNKELYEDYKNHVFDTFASDKVVDTPFDSLDNESYKNGTKNLLNKTLDMFNRLEYQKTFSDDYYITTLDDSNAMQMNKTLIARPEIANNGGNTSRGRNLRTNGTQDIESSESNTTRPFSTNLCRVWTKYHQYSKHKDRIRPFYDSNGTLIDIRDKIETSLRPNNGITNLKKYSTLNQDGFVQVVPTPSNFKDNIKNYMFSIENLAWRDLLGKSGLSKEQIGPNQGRIMWFPPYNLKFTENVNVEWNSNKFIGRGEQIHTYVNTERSGTLSFTLLIDHPSVLNKIAKPQGNETSNEVKQRILRFFAGCADLDALGTEEKVDEVVDTKPDDNNGTQNPKPKTTEYKDVVSAYIVFYPNNFSGSGKSVDDIIEVLDAYEITPNGRGKYSDADFEQEVLQPGNDVDVNSIILINTNEGISSQLDDLKIMYDDYFSKINRRLQPIKKLAELPNEFDKYSYSIEIYSFASNAGTEKNNNKLIQRRNKTAEILLKHYAFSEINYEIKGGKIINVDKYVNDVNNIYSKLARASIILITQKLPENATNFEELDNNGEVVLEDGTVIVTETPNGGEETQENQEKIVTAVTSVNKDELLTYDNEYLYFSEIGNDDVSLENIRNKVSIFTPAFHSVTAEGFNARLTFLHQCTRQGPTYSLTNAEIEQKEYDKENESESDKNKKKVNSYLSYAGSLAFGRAPYCVLRIGDFFNTKICIESLSIDYNNGDGIQWDLNPEGAGVQPMMANININFKFLGGQDISGPIERLQNAVTANYYANASIYDRHADNKESYYDVLKDDGNSTSNGRISKERRY